MAPADKGLASKGLPENLSPERGPVELEYCLLLNISLMSCDEVLSVSRPANLVSSAS